MFKAERKTNKPKHYLLWKLKFSLIQSLYFKILIWIAHLGFSHFRLQISEFSPEVFLNKKIKTFREGSSYKKSMPFSMFVLPTLWPDMN